MVKPLVEVHNLGVDYATDRAWHSVLRGIDLELRAGEVVGLAGESGCGKSTLASLLLGERHGARRITAGSVTFDGIDLFAAPRATLRSLRGARIALVPQNGGSALTPTLRIGTLFAETLHRHRRGLSRVEARARAVEGLAEVGLPHPDVALNRYPHQFSGGQQQRIALALALLCDPDLLLLDEPTTGQDTLIRRSIVAQLGQLAVTRRMTMVFISHDLATLAELCDRIIVMAAGEIVEDGPAGTVLGRPAHPYTQGLVAALPQLHRQPVATLSDAPLDRDRLPEGCRFAPRCPHATPPCSVVRQRLTPVALGHLAACMRLPLSQGGDVDARAVAVDALS